MTFLRAVFLLAFLLISISVSKAQDENIVAFTHSEWFLSPYDTQYEVGLTRLPANGLINFDMVAPTNVTFLSSFTNKVAMRDHQSGTNYLIQISARPSTNSQTAAFKLINPRVATNENPRFTPTLETNSFFLTIPAFTNFQFIFEKSYYNFPDRPGDISIKVVLLSPVPDGVSGVSVDYELVDLSTLVDDSGEPLDSGIRPGSDIANENTDYSPTSGTLTFEPGQREQTITIPLIKTNLTEYEFNEDFAVRLSNPQGSVTTTNAANEQTTINYSLGEISATIVTLLAQNGTNVALPGGAVDITYNPDNASPSFLLNPGANGTVLSIATMPDGSTFVGGEFTAMNSVPRNRIAKMRPDGSLDTTFSPSTGADNFVSSVDVYTFGPLAGRVLIGGGFSSVNGHGRGGIARLLSNGQTDLTFNPGSGANGPIYAVKILGDFSILVGGDFTEIDGIAAPGIARLFSNGTLDLSFNPGFGFDGPVFALDAERASSITYTNSASGTNNTTLNQLVDIGAVGGQITIRYNLFDDLDRFQIFQGNTLVFDTGITNTIITVTNADQTTYETNTFITTNLFFGPGSSTQLRFVVSNTNETANWNIQASISPAANGRIIVGGDFTSVDGQVQQSIARLLANGTPDPTFDPGLGVHGQVLSVSLDSANRIIIGGDFTEVNSKSANSLARLNADGSLDETFSSGSGVDGIIQTVKYIAGRDELYIGGTFTVYNGSHRLYLARLLSNGSVDPTFLDTIQNAYAGFPLPNGVAPTVFDGSIRAINHDRTGLLVGGFFRRVGGGFFREEVHSRQNFARLSDAASTIYSPGLVEFASAEFGSDEAGGDLGAPVIRTLGITGSILVYGSTFEGSATIGRDYTPVTNSLIRFDDSNAQTLFIPIFDDEEIEGNETFGVELDSLLGGFTLGGQVILSAPGFGRNSEAIVTIVEDDQSPAVLNIAETEIDTDESSGTVTIRVTRSGNTGTSGQVAIRTVTTSPNGAASGSDFVAINLVSSFAPGQTSRTFTLQIRNDEFVEPDETFRVEIFNPSSGFILGTNSVALVTIIDNDYLPGRINFASTNFNVAENNGFATVQVRRSGGSVGVLSVEYRTEDGPFPTGTSVPFDYTETAGVLVWNDQETTPKTIQIPISNDSIVETSEQFSLILFNPSQPDALGSRSNSTVTILEDDGYGQFSFGVDRYIADENGTSAGIMVIRRNGTSGEAAVTFQAQPGTALPNIDFVPVTNLLTFQPGEVSKIVYVPILNDSVSDSNRTVNLQLRNPVTGTLGALTNALLTILDDEQLNIPAGDVEFDFAADVDDIVYSLLIEGENGPGEARKIILGGQFRTVENQSRRGLARINDDGSLDSTFARDIDFDGPIRAMLFQGTNRIIVAGAFENVDGLPRRSMARVTRSGAVDSTFSIGAGADGPVYTLGELVISTNPLISKVVVGGGFLSINSIQRAGIALLNEDGTVDLTFNPGSGVQGTVFALAVQPDGKIIIGGDFTSVGGTPQSGIARLNSNGTIDTNFNAGLGVAGTVRAIKLQPDGKILIGGLFNSVSDVPFNSIARLESTGALDSTFNPGPGVDGPVYALDLQPDGKIIVAGDFTKFGEASQNRILRLNPNGTLDTSINFGSGANGFIAAVKIQSDRRIIVGGNFTKINDIPRSHFARLFGGSISGSGEFEMALPTINVNESGTNAIVTIRRRGGTEGNASVSYVLSGESAFPGSDYIETNATVEFLSGEASKTINLLLLDDNIAEQDESFLVTLTNAAGASIISPRQPFTRVIIVSDDSLVSFAQTQYSASEGALGNFITIRVVRTGKTLEPVTVVYSTVGGSATAGVDYVSQTGTLTFQPNQENQFFTVNILGDESVEGNESVTLRLDEVIGNGSLGLRTATLTIYDDDFAPGVLSFENGLLISEGSGTASVVVRRESGVTGAVSVDYIITPLTASTDDFSASSGTLTLIDGQASQSIPVQITGDSAPEGNESFLVELTNPTGGAMLGNSVLLVTIVDDDFGAGSFDQTFNIGNGADGAIAAVKIQPDGKLVIGGDFDAFNGFSAPGVARLLPNGSIDNSFLAGGGAAGSVFTVDTAPDGKVAVGGGFTTFDGAVRNRVSLLSTNGFLDPAFFKSAGINGPVYAVAVQPDGQIIVGGSFSNPSPNLIRLNVDGSHDVSFDVEGGAKGAVRSLLLQPDGKILVGGSFTNIAGTTRRGFARLLSSGRIDPVFATGSGANGTVFDIARTEGGNILLAGEFTSVNGTPRNRVARLEQNGAVDTTFTPAAGPNGTVLAVAVQQDGKVLLGGEFSSVTGTNRTRIARLLNTGALDTTFDPGSGADDSVLDIHVQADRQILVAGAFFTLNGFPSPGIGRLNGDLDPAHTEITITNVVITAQGAISFGFLTETGKNYQIQGSTDLEQWTTIQPVSGTGSTTTFSETIGAIGTHKFYRVMLVP
ncbi:MAG: Calx-beta domain-containing protein [Verrucomicrobiota bacterium]|nr:Calx-beta domain-containing protein [Verrucomicrobiota bacterium]